MKKVPVGLWAGVSALVVFGGGTLVAQERASVRRRVEVFARTITIVVTDAKGKPPAVAPRLEDLLVEEDGVASPVVGLEPIGPPSVPAAAKGEAKVEAKEPAPGGDDAGAPAERERHQVLYVDLGLLRSRSPAEVAAGVRTALPKLLALGPLEIVLADPEPKTLVPATDDAAALEAGLKALASRIGRDQISQRRRQWVDTQTARTVPRQGDAAAARAEVVRPTAYRESHDEGVTGTQDFGAKAFSDAEIVYLGESFRRLRSFAEGSLLPQPRVLYLASDGFDMDPNLFYAPREPNRTLAGAGPKLLALVSESSAALLRTGWVVVPVAPGSSVGAVSTDRGAETPGGSGSLAPPGKADFLLQRPVDGLRQIADTTGGTVVLDAAKTADALVSLKTTYLLSYTVDHAPDGREHRLAVRSRSGAFLVRSSPTVAAGTLEGGAAARAAGLLSEHVEKGELPVTLEVDEASTTDKGKLASQVTVRVRLADVRRVLMRLGASKLRITLAVELPGSAPAVHHEELSVPESVPDVFTVKAPLVRPRNATRVAVLAEELSSGLWGGAVVPLAAEAAAR